MSSLCLYLPLKLNTVLQALSRQKGVVGNEQTHAHAHTHMKHTAVHRARSKQSRTTSAVVLTVQTVGLC